MIKKTLQPTNDLFIQFTEEELTSIGAGPGTKFSVKHNEDGSIELRPYSRIEIDLEGWPREILELLIKESCERDVSVNDVVCGILEEQFEHESI